MNWAHKAFLVLLFHLSFYKTIFLSILAVSDETLLIMDSELNFSNWLNSILNSDTQNSTIIHIAPSKPNYRNFNWYSNQLVIPGIVDKLEIDYFRSKPNLTYSKFVQKYKDRRNVLIVRIPIRTKSTEGGTLEKIQKKLSWIINEEKDYYIYYDFLQKNGKKFPSINDQTYETGNTQYTIRLLIKFDSIFSGFTLNVYSKCFYNNKWTEIEYNTLRLHTRILNKCPTVFVDKVLKVACPQTYFKLFFKPSVFVKGEWYLSHGLFGFSINTLSKKFNFTIKLSLSPAYGNLDPETGIWSGIVGDLIKKEVDIGMAVTQNYPRNGVISLSSPLNYVWLTFTTPTPRQRYSWRSTYRPLEPSVWLTVFVCMSTTLFFLHLIQKLENYTTKSKTVLKTFVPEILSLFVEQSPVTLVKTQNSQYSVKAMLSFWLLFNLIIATCYRTTMVSLLTFPNIAKPLKTFEDVAKSHPSEYEVTLHTDKTGAQYDIFRFTNSSLLRSIYNRLHFEADRAKCLGKGIGQGDGSGLHHICVIYSHGIDFALSTAFKHYPRPPFIRSEDSISFSYDAFAFSKDSPYRNMFDADINRFIAMGLAAKWLTLTYSITKLDEILNERKSLWRIFDVDRETDQVKFHHLIGVFYVCLVGLSGAVFLFFVEYLYQYFNCPLEKLLNKQ